MKAQKKAPRAFESGEATRLDQIYKVAARLFCDQGYDATAMSDIADEVGITSAQYFF